MVRLFYQGLVAMALIGGSAADKQPCVVLTATKGGDHGTPFTDQVTMDTVITHIDGRSADRVDAIGVCSGPDPCLLHGGDGGTFHTKPISSDHHVSQVAVYQTKQGGHTKVGGIVFTIKENEGDESFEHTVGKIKGLNDREIFVAPGHGRLIGLHGKADQELDQIGIMWSDGDCMKREKEKTAAPPVQAPPVGPPPYPGVPPAGSLPYPGVPPAGSPPYTGVPPPGYPSYYQGVPPAGYPPYYQGAPAVGPPSSSQKPGQNPHHLSIGFETNLDEK